MMAVTTHILRPGGILNLLPLHMIRREMIKCKIQHHTTLNHVR